MPPPTHFRPSCSDVHMAHRNCHVTSLHNQTVQHRQPIRLHNQPIVHRQRSRLHISYTSPHTNTAFHTPPSCTDVNIAHRNSSLNTLNNKPLTTRKTPILSNPPNVHSKP